jgi:hypothetical protein
MARYWLSFDLGFLSESDKLFEWLDSHDAKECGDGVATFQSDRSKSQISKDISRLVDDETRLYLIDMKSDGRFISGKRKKKAPWDGYAGVVVEVDDAT